MNNNLKSNHLIITSEKSSILFQLGTDNTIKCTYLDKDFYPIKTKTLFKKDVLKYSADIDSLDNIHLITLNKNGELKYSILKDEKWTHKTIAKFELHSKIYDNIVFFAEENNIDLLYSYANLINSKLWTVRHITGNIYEIDQFNATKYAQEKTLIPFSVDKDSSNSIHLLYRALVNDKYHLYHTFYNPYTKKWNPISNKLTSNNSYKLFPHIFVDSRDNLHAVWIDKINNDNIVKYSKLQNNSKNNWTEISIPNIYDYNNPPIIMEEEGILKIIYSNNLKIGYIYSPDYGTTWLNGKETNIESNNLLLVKISSNLSKPRNTKIVNAYFSIKNKIIPYFINNLYSVKFTLDANSNKSDEKITDESIDDKIYELFKKQDEIKNILFEILDSQNILQKNINDILEYIKAKKTSFIDKIFK